MLTVPAKDATRRVDIYGDLPYLMRGLSAPYTASLTVKPSGKSGSCSTYVTTVAFGDSIVPASQVSFFPSTYRRA